MIPVKIIVTGDITRGRELVGFAKAEMAKLERLMSFQGLQQGSRTVSPFPGVVVECWSKFSLQQIHVHVVPPPSGGEEPPPEPKKKKECLCFPHFAFAIVTKVTPAIPLRADFDFTADYDTALQNYEKDLYKTWFQYDLEICHQTFYIKYEGAYDANFGRYYKGQYVLVTMADDMDAWQNPTDCNRACLVDSPKFDKLTIAPLHVLKNMNEWGPEHDDA